MSQGGHEEDKQHQEHHRLHDEKSELAHPTLELRLGRTGRQPGSDLSERRPSPRGKDQGRRGAADHRSPQQYFAAFVCGLAGLPLRLSLLLHGQRLTGECGLLNVKVLALNQARIGRHQVSAGQPDHIARHCLNPREFQPIAIPEHTGRRRHGALQTLQGNLRPGSLDEIDPDAEQYDDNDNDRIEAFAENS